MSADTFPFAQAEAWLRDRRHALAHHLEEAMSHLTDLIENGKKLASERADLIVDRDSQKSRAEAAEAHAAELQAKIDADDKTAGAAADDLAAEIAKEAGVSGSTPEAVKAPASDNVLVQGQPPITSTTATGAATTVFATSTEHTASDGTVTTLDHVTGTATAVDASGTPVEPAPAAVAEAVSASADAGVTVPAADPVIPTTVG